MKCSLLLICVECLVSRARLCWIVPNVSARVLISDADADMIMSMIMTMSSSIIYHLSPNHLSRIRSHLSSIIYHLIISSPIRCRFLICVECLGARARFCWFVPNVSARVLIYDADADMIMIMIMTMSSSIIYHLSPNHLSRISSHLSSIIYQLII